MGMEPTDRIPAIALVRSPQVFRLVLFFITFWPP
jgi:hypothetical protein